MAGQEIKAGRAVVEVSLRDRVGKGLVAIERKLASTGRNIATLGAVLAGGGLAAVAWPLKLAADMEQTATSFEVMTGSAEKGKGLLEDLKKFAASTPFGFTELADNAKMLLSYGVATENVTGTLRLLGDVSGGSAERLGRLTLAYGQVQAKGRLMGQEVLQMVENSFNPLQYIALRTGEGMATLTKRMEAGGIAAGEVTQAFIDATSGAGRFAGLMDRQANTGAGLLAQILDNATFALTDFGTQLLEALKPGLQFVLGVSKALRGFISANSGVLKILGLVAVGVVAVGGVLVGLGLGALALSTIVGGLATAWGFFVGAIAALFTPMGAVIALLGLAAVVAFNFRGAIASALSGIADYFAPVGAAIYRVYEIFATTFSGILAALGGGQLEAAAGIAWLGFVAAAWQGIAELGSAIDAGIAYLQAWIPGVDGVKNYVTAAFASMGQAVLAGRWDIAAAIMMAKIRLAVATGWNAVADTWTGFSVGISTTWDNIVSGIQTTWRTAVNEIAKWLVWLAEQAGMNMDGVKAELARMNAADQKQADKAQAGREQGRYAAGADAIAKRAQEAQAIRNQIAALEEQANQSYSDAGAPTVSDAAANARKQLEDAIAKAKKQREESQGGGQFSPNLPSLAANAGQQMKVESKGTFSAAAATLLGGPSGDYQRLSFDQLQLIATRIGYLNDKYGAGATI
jgi:tape measure domain-containing protein